MEKQTETDTQPQSTWWTTAGFVLKPTPNAFASMPESTYPDEQLFAAGYRERCKYGEEFDALEITVRQHVSGEHLFVDVFSDGSGVGNFFVATQDSDAFFATWYVGFIHDAAVVKQAATLSIIQKTFTAFVRHGHGETTISEGGEWSRDEYLREESLYNERKAKAKRRENAEQI